MKKIVIPLCLPVATACMAWPHEGEKNRFLLCQFLGIQWQMSYKIGTNMSRFRVSVVGQWIFFFCMVSSANYNEVEGTDIPDSNEDTPSSLWYLHNPSMVLRHLNHHLAMASHQSQDEGTKSME